VTSKMGFNFDSLLKYITYYTFSSCPDKLST